MRSVIALCIAPLALAMFGLSAPASAQSSASTYSYGTYNPVQAAINRNSMNAAILRQATGGNRKAHAGATRRRGASRRRR